VVVEEGLAVGFETVDDGLKPVVGLQE